MGPDSHPNADAARVANQVAHELGTALALISGYSDSLREALGPPAPGTEVAASLDGIERGVARLRSVSDRLAAWARTQRAGQQAPGEGAGPG